MGVIPILLICSIAVAAVFLAAFLWATRQGQYDDLHTPALRILFEDRPAGTDRSVAARRINADPIPGPRSGRND